jgi:hypothetical protein
MADECASFEECIKVYMHSIKKTLKINLTHPVVSKIIKQLKIHAECKSIKEKDYLLTNITFL